MQGMPKNRAQGVIFGILMSITMAYGMEVYNVAWKMGIPTMPGGFSNMTNDVFLGALAEAAYMWLFVELFSSLFGNRLGSAMAARHTDPKRDNPYFCQLLRQGCTVMVMCPTMSLVASVLFNVILGGMPLVQLPAIWVGTLIKNFPMALFWNLFGAAPLSRLVFRTFFSHVGERKGEQSPAAA